MNDPTNTCHIKLDLRLDLETAPEFIEALARLLGDMLPGSELVLTDNPDDH